MSINFSSTMLMNIRERLLHVRMNIIENDFIVIVRFRPGVCSRPTCRRRLSPQLIFSRIENGISSALPLPFGSLSRKTRSTFINSSEVVGTAGQFVQPVLANIHHAVRLSDGCGIARILPFTETASHAACGIFFFRFGPYWSIRSFRGEILPALTKSLSGPDQI